jgi:OFA family oxalate/formate antiporter-like MFS transporter
VRNLGVNYGLLFTSFGVAGIFGPILGGKVRDLLGSYNHSFVISAVLLLIGAVLAMTIRPRKTEAAPPGSPEPALARR